MKVKERKEATGGLGHPSKMPGRSWGIAASECKLGAVLARKPGSVCSGCYAAQGRYIYPSVKIAHARRLAAYRSDPARWEAGMVASILAEVDPGDPYFRWFDSGDLQSVSMLESIVRVVRATPHVQHWLPTRERGIVRDWIAAGGVVPRNLRIRVSAAMVGQRQTIPASWRRRGITTSSVDAGGRPCPAPLQGNSCGDCRACWSREADVSYSLH